MVQSQSQQMVQSQPRPDNISISLASSQILSECISQLPQVIGPTFVDPSQYLTAIPVQPVLTAEFPSAASIISSIQVSYKFY